MVAEKTLGIRNLAATLLTFSGTAHIAALWFKDITPTVLASASLGALYLFIGLGLYGQSRFALFLGIIVPALGVWLTLDESGAVPSGLESLVHLSVAALVAILSAIVLVLVRNNPSV